MNSIETRSSLHRFSELAVALATIPGAVGLATEFWLHGDVPSRHVGLWKTCGAADNGHTACSPLRAHQIPDWLTAVRGLCVMALCIHVISVLTGWCIRGLGALDLLTVSFFPRLEETFAVIAGLLMATGMAIFARSTETHAVFSSLRFDWSFWLCSAHVCLLLVFAGVMALSRDDCACLERCMGHRHRHRGGRRSTSTRRFNGRFNGPKPKTAKQDTADDTGHLYGAAARKETKEGMAFIQVPFFHHVPEANDLLGHEPGTERAKFFSSYEGLPHLFHKAPPKTSDVSDV